MKVDTSASAPRQVRVHTRSLPDWKPDTSTPSSVDLFLAKRLGAAWDREDLTGVLDEDIGAFDAIAAY